MNKNESGLEMVSWGGLVYGCYLKGESFLVVLTANKMISITRAL